MPMAAGHVAMDDAAYPAGNVQRVETGCLLLHGMAITGVAEVRTVAEAEACSGRRKLPSTPQKPRARERGLVAGAVRTLSDVSDI